MWGDNTLEDNACIIKGNYESLIFLNMNKIATQNVASKIQQVIVKKKKKKGRDKEWFNIGKYIDIFNGLKNK